MVSSHMKSFNFKFLVVMGLVLVAGSVAQAKEKKMGGIKEDAISVSQSVESRSSGAGKFGLGFSEYSGFSGFSNNIAGYLKLTDTQALQFNLGLTTSGAFSFTGGAIYKHTIASSQNAGFHVGGGLTIGTLQSSFALSVAGVAGLHFRLADAPHVMFSFDGGPTFTVVGGASNFNLTALSGLLGASVIYML